MRSHIPSFMCEQGEGWFSCEGGRHRSVLLTQVFRIAVVVLMDFGA